MTRIKVSDLTSAIGALVLGVGLGALLPGVFGRLAVPITAIGAVVHALGMWDKRRLEEQQHVVNDRWVVALYWVCWLLLAGVVVALVFWR
jgi:hypothetical protein